MKGNIYHLPLAALLLTSGLALLGQPQTGQQKAVQRNWKLNPSNPAPEPTNEEERARRQARGAMFDDPKHAKRRLDIPDPNEGRIVYGRSPGTPLKIPALPVSESDTVIIGSVASLQPYFSNDRTSIYHELVVQVEQVLKDKSLVVAAPNGSVAIVGEGGALRLPNGKVAEEFIPPDNENDIRIGGRYVLFLRYRPQGEAFSLIKAWQLMGGRAVPMALWDIHEMRNGLSPYAAMDEATFIKAVRDAVSQSEARL